MDISFFENPAIIWIICGIAGLLLELAVPGLIIIFFGAGAIITGFAYWLTPLQIEFQLLTFLISSVVLLLLFRKTLQKRFFDSSDTSKDELEQEFIGKQAEALADFVEGTGKVSFKGTTWNANSQDSIKQGNIVTIIKRDSLTLIVTLK
ncbi:MAG TPA: NfeD family protein [Bacteroidales bacterium]|nr:NfeD family protein [Bacteroidales bacterium]